MKYSENPDKQYHMMDLWYVIRNQSERRNGLCLMWKKLDYNII